MIRCIEVMGYTIFYVSGTDTGSDYFTPTGACFRYFPPEVWPFPFSLSPFGSLALSIFIYALGTIWTRTRWAESSSRCSSQGGF